MKNTKVVLPKEIAEAIEELRNNGVYDFGIMVGIADYDSGRTQDHVELFGRLNMYFCDTDPESELHPNKLMDALVNGYEVEKSREDKLREHFTPHRYTSLFYLGKSLDIDETKQERYSTGYASGFKEALNILGITVEGIND